LVKSEEWVQAQLQFLDEYFKGFLHNDRALAVAHILCVLGERCWHGALEDIVEIAQKEYLKMYLLIIQAMNKLHSIVKVLMCESRKGNI
jgi:hypothetical protein